MASHDSRAAGRAAVPGHAGDERISARAAVPVSPPPTATYGEPPGGEPPGSGPPGARVTRRRPWRRRLLVTALVVLLVGGIGAGALVWYTRGLDDNMGRTDAFSGITGERPAPAEGGSKNILLLGDDSRDPDQIERADTIMLMHIPSSQDEAYVISLPRDLWVYVPRNAADTNGGREAKINAASAWGGIPLTVQTIEGYTGVRIDHVMVIDFAGFVEVTDALGGVEMEIEQTITSIHPPHRTFEAGTRELDGEEALDYVRQRKQFSDGDFTRMRNQQQFLKALMDKAASTGTLTNPGRLNGFLQTATSTLTVDQDFSLVETGFRFRNLRSHNLTFLTSPHRGTGQVGTESVVFSDDETAAEFYRAVKDDRLAGWLAANPDLNQG